MSVHDSIFKSIFNHSPVIETGEKVVINEKSGNLEWIKTAVKHEKVVEARKILEGLKEALQGNANELDSTSKKIYSRILEVVKNKEAKTQLANELDKLIAKVMTLEKRTQMFKAKSQAIIKRGTRPELKRTKSSSELKKLRNKPNSPPHTRSGRRKKPTSIETKPTKKTRSASPPTTKEKKALKKQEKELAKWVKKLKKLFKDSELYKPAGMEKIASFCELSKNNAQQVAMGITRFSGQDGIHIIDEDGKEIKLLDDKQIPKGLNDDQIKYYSIREKITNLLKYFQKKLGDGGYDAAKPFFDSTIPKNKDDIDDENITGSMKEIFENLCDKNKKLATVLNQFQQKFLNSPRGIAIHGSNQSDIPLVDLRNTMNITFKFDKNGKITTNQRSTLVKSEITKRNSDHPFFVEACIELSSHTGHLDKWDADMFLRVIQNKLLSTEDQNFIKKLVAMLKHLGFDPFK